jgi:hypothetical protein
MMAGRFDEDTYARARKWREQQEAKAAEKPAAKTPSKVRVSNPVPKKAMAQSQDMRHMQDTISMAERNAARGAKMQSEDRARAMAADEQRKRTRAKLAMEDKAAAAPKPLFGRNPRGETPQQVRSRRGYGAAKKG